jgi:hypothetical protein
MIFDCPALEGGESLFQLLNSQLDFGGTELQSKESVNGSTARTPPMSQPPGPVKIINSDLI